MKLLSKDDIRRIKDSGSGLATYEEWVSTIYEWIAYRDSGLTPEEVDEMKAELTRLTTKIEALELAIKKETLPGVMCRMCTKTECNECINGSDWRFAESRYIGGQS